MCYAGMCVRISYRPNLDKRILIIQQDFESGINDLDSAIKEYNKAELEGNKLYTIGEALEIYKESFLKNSLLFSEDGAVEGGKPMLIEEV